MAVNSFTTFYGTVAEPKAGTKAERFRPTLVKRAKKRKVQEDGDGGWIVEGSSALSDSYPAYYIRLEGDTYFCSCQQHLGGMYRQVCSHIVAVILWRSGEHPDSEGSGTQESLETIAQEPPPKAKAEPADLPAEGVEGEEVVEAVVEPVPDIPIEIVTVTESTHPKLVAPAELPDKPPSPQHPMFGSPPLPEKFEKLFPHQWEAIREIVEHFNNGVKAVFLSAPTGSGKTVIGEAVRRLVNGTKPATYACVTKSLQDQILRDFAYAKVLKGRSNYPVADPGHPDITANDCEIDWTTLPVVGCVGCVGSHSEQAVQHCEWCHPVHRCPYRVAREEALTAPLAVLNVAYLLTESNLPKSRFSGREFTIIDEADEIEMQLMSYAEVLITPRVRREVGIRTMPKKTVEDDWVRWLRDEFIPAVVTKIAEYRNQLYGKVELPIRRRINALKKLADACTYLAGEEDSISESGFERTRWVLTGYEGKSSDQARLIFKPVKIGEWARDLLWRHSKQWLLMSATFVSPEDLAARLALDEDEYEVVKVPSTFPVERRPVFFRGVANMTHKTKETEWPLAAQEIKSIVEGNPGCRILVHTVSYALTDYLRDELMSPRVVTYRSSSERDAALSRFLSRPDSVLLAPSFERGVDLPGEDCEIIVIAKVPWPNLGDKQIKARLYETSNGQTWFSIETIRSIVQMTGRGMRSKEDFCDTYIIDKQFRRLYVRNKRLFPSWWQEAVVLSEHHPDAQALIEAAELRREGRKTRTLELDHMDDSSSVEPLPDPF